MGPRAAATANAAITGRKIHRRDAEGAEKPAETKEDSPRLALSPAEGSLSKGAKSEGLS